VTFFLGDPYRVRCRASGDSATAPRAVVAGPQTVPRVDLLVSGTVETFTIHFQPAGFHQLFGVPMRELQDATCDTAAILGIALRPLEVRLADAGSFAERVGLVEAHLRTRPGSAGRLDAVAHAANRLFAADGRLGISDMAAASGMSRRHFGRRFLEQVGVPPKRYARLARFNAALDHKLMNPSRPWSAVAHALGYADQMHLVRDFRELAGHAPSAMVARFDAVPAFQSMVASASAPVRVETRSPHGLGTSRLFYASTRFGR
jgi:AraC-like DNA-binding protein